MRTHVVQKGDTLWKIAKQYGISFDELKRLNGHLENPEYVVPGMEIILPDNISNSASKSATTRTTGYKEKLTEPFAPIVEQSTQQVDKFRPTKEEMTKPIPEKELQTQPVEQVQPSKEQITRPFPEYIMPTPAPMPQVHPEYMPEFHFAPQFTFTQPTPQPMPQPMPMPQPIMVEVPKPEVKIEEKEVTKTEYVPVPHPYYVYIPYCPEPVKPPCPCKQHHMPRPCGCGGGMQHPMHMPVQQPMPMPIQHMEMPCGCHDSAPYNHMMMPYDSNFMQPQYFEPNYDIAPVMEDDGKDSTLPDWLVDSSSGPDVMGVSQHHGKGEMYDDYLDDKDQNVTDYYHQMRGNEDSQFSPSEHYGHYDMNYPTMHHMPYQPMPDNFMPYQAMPDDQMSQHYMQQPMPHTMMQHPHMMQQHMNYPTQPYYPNQYHNSSNFKPWSY